MKNEMCLTDRLSVAKRLKEVSNYSDLERFNRYNVSDSVAYQTQNYQEIKQRLLYKMRH